MKIRLYKLLDDSRAQGKEVLFEEKAETTIATVEKNGNVLATFRRVDASPIRGLLTEWELQP